MSLMTDYEV